MADEPPKKDPPPPPPAGYQFTLKIITPDGLNVYTVEASQLSQIATPQSINSGSGDGKNDVRELVDLSAPISHRRYEGPGNVDLFGTFIVNLSVYNPNK
ncbi:MAG TPA: hypothetical protein VNO30_21255 [Kofleriaceae bacterium]|nr:hypothetical protein [Kofleriaceae bacterium]